MHINSVKQEFIIVAFKILSLEAEYIRKNSAEGVAPDLRNIVNRCWIRVLNQPLESETNQQRKMLPSPIFF